MSILLNIVLLMILIGSFALIALTIVGWRIGLSDDDAGETHFWDHAEN